MHECTIIILGATGDLTKRKLIPALYKLVEGGKLQKFAVVGASLVDTSPDEILENSKKFISDLKLELWQVMSAAFYYQRLDFYQDDDYVRLRELVNAVERTHQLSGNRLFYLATMPEHFAQITEMLACHDIAHRALQGPWSRVVYEKPFGSDLTSARAINKAIARVFSEEQAYRIDHYLGKELIGNITLLRFTNLFFEPLWNNRYIDSVQIILSEDIGIEGRGAYYDRYGVLKDVIQNHCLQMLALVAMESPLMLTGECIRDAKTKVFKKVHVQDMVAGQVDSYRNEPGVTPGSQTETFAALKLAIENKRWRGVPFFIKAGKYLGVRETSIHIKFKEVKCLLSQNCPFDSNYLTIRVQPEDGFFLELYAKVPDKAYEITPIKMDFCHSCIFGPNSPGAYEVLLLDVMRGDQSTFVRFDEIELSWKIIDEIPLKGRKIYSYRQSSNGPSELEEFNKRHKIRWRV